MARFILFLILLIPLAHAGLWLASHPGNFMVHWLGYEVRISIGLAALSLVLLTLLTLFIGMALDWVMRLPERKRMRRALRENETGLQQLTRALISASQNDYPAARQALLKASSNFSGSPLPHLIGMQLSVHHGQTQHAREHLHVLRGHESTAMLAVRHALAEALRRGERAEAEGLLQEATLHYPRARWVLEMRLRLALLNDAYASLIADLTRFTLRPLLPAPTRKRWLSRLYFLQHRDGDALANDAAFIPAAVRAAESALAKGESAKALRILKTCWQKNPSTPVLEVVLRLSEPMLPKAQLKLAQRFAKLAYPHAEAEDILARTHQRLEKLDDALAHAKRAMELNATRARFSRIAEIVSARDGAEAANLWLKEAVNAAQSEGWYCNTCGTRHEEWHMVCTHCDALDTLEYKARAAAQEVLPVAA